MAGGAVSALAVIEAPASAECEPDRLGELEQVIASAVADGLASVIAIGAALAEIKDRELHLVAYPSFRAYVADRFSFSEAWAHQAIYTAKVAAAITAAGHGLPHRLSADALKPLWPVLNSEGAEAVGTAWNPVRPWG